MSDNTCDVVIVRYDEIALKSPPVRRRFEDVLIGRIKTALSRHGIVYSGITREWGRIFVHTSDEAAADVISRVFGTASASPAITTGATLESAAETAAQIGRGMIKDGESFAIRASRSGIHDFTSIDLASACGDAVVGCTAAKVDLTNPDREIFIDMRREHAYVYTRIAAGVGGLPYGTQGKMIALVSGGIDSPVAAWMMMRRGAEIVPLYFDLEEFTDPKTRELAEQSINLLFEWSYSDNARDGEFFTGVMTTYRIPYGAVLREIVRRCDPRITCVICKRMMYRIGIVIAEKEDACGIITGSSLGQVASQTSQNMLAEMHGLGMPIYHPLIGMDKREIIDRATRIGTFRTEKPATECAAVPAHPVTAATVARVAENEARIDVARIVSDAVAGSSVPELLQ
ncbi:MAG: tRNA uracil 4-sulfurtransferase ThiI [archaeon]|nr:tRNA uracil 4-sulfurtransferase ThiI [archaeon]